MARALENAICLVCRIRRMQYMGLDEEIVQKVSLLLVHPQLMYYGL